MSVGQFTEEAERVGRKVRMAAWDTKVLWSFTFLLAGETQSASSSFVLLLFSLLLKTTNKQEEISGDTKEVTAGLE